MAERVEREINKSDICTRLSVLRSPEPTGEAEERLWPRPGSLGSFGDAGLQTDQQFLAGALPMLFFQCIKERANRGGHRIALQQILSGLGTIPVVRFHKRPVGKTRRRFCGCRPYGEVRHARLAHEIDLAYSARGRTYRCKDGAQDLGQRLLKLGVKMRFIPPIGIRNSRQVQNECPPDA